MNANKLTKKNSINTTDLDNVSGTFIKKEMAKVDDSNYNEFMTEIKKEVKNDIKLIDSVKKSVKIKNLGDLQEFKKKIEEQPKSEKELIKEKEMDTVKEKHSRYIVTRKRQMMYQMHPIKWSAKRNLYHYYYDNPFSRIFRWRYNGIPKIFNEMPLDSILLFCDCESHPINNKHRQKRILNFICFIRIMFI